MDSASLRLLKPRELALYLRHASKEQSAKTVSTYLLEAIELEALPPTVFDTFLTSVKSSCLLKDALWQDYSKHVRYAAIRRFGQDLKGVDWEVAWQEVGGTEGLLDLFSQLSVSEVKHLSKVIGRCPGRPVVKNGYERQRRVTELVQGLMYQLYPTSPYQSKDQRPLHSQYAQMVPACTSDFVENLLRQDSHPLLDSIRMRTLVQNQYELLRKLVLEAISQQDSLQAAAAQRVLDYIPLLLQSGPSIPVAEPRFSASMSLAVNFLERITAGKAVRFPDRILMPHLMVPLMRRLQAHKVEPDRVRQVVQLARMYLQRHDYARTDLSLARRNLICYIARYWSRDAPLFEGCLIDFIGLLRGSSHSNRSFGSSFGGSLQKGLYCYQDLLHQVAKPNRYDLLRIVCLHSADMRVNIEADDELKTTKIEKWPISIFKILQRDHSTFLLQRLVRLKPEANFLELCSYRSILSQARSPNSDCADPRLLLAILESGNEVAKHEAQLRVETLKSKASKSREQLDRAFFAKSAAFHAIASGDLTLYGDVLQWTRRFLRDANTVKTVYSSGATLTAEGIALLRGIPEELDHWTAAEIPMRITQANSIMLELLDTAVTSLREPSFYARDWDGPLSIFGQVVNSRISGASPLKSYFQLSEDEIYDILWPKTIEMLLHAEEIGLKYEALGFNSPHGPLGLNTLYVSTPSPSFYRFLDNLARSRDALWKNTRPTMDPAVAALEPPWPRGLPVQCLMGSFNVAVDSAFNQTPFIANRAAEIVMTDPAVAFDGIPTDKETRRAIGQFIDSFHIALAIYVMQAPSGFERDGRVYAAWSHAINALSQRLSKNEAELFWRDVFDRAIPQVENPDSEIKVITEYPVIPTDDDPREPLEWNPAAKIPPDVEPRELPATSLDCMIQAPPSLRWNTRHDFHVAKLETQIRVSSPIWSHERLAGFQKLPMPVQEGMIATALLLESSKVQESKILALPFPSETNVRYPSLFLDHDFLLSEHTLKPPANVALSHFIEMVPSTLLLDLTTSALNALSQTPSDSTKFASIERTAFSLLMLLSESDRPPLASNLIVRTVLDRPDASSWHRQLLTRNFVKSLSARQAQDMISYFASSILKVLEQKVTIPRNEQKAEGSDTSSGRYVKITTVKFLAQLLDDADFVSPGFCVDTLSKLFQKALHLDIRVAVLDSMLSRLGRCTDKASDALAERLMSALETAIPILGSLNERQQTQDVSWAEAEKTGKLPEVYDDGGMQTIPPMLSVVLRTNTGYDIPQDILRRGYIQRIIVPVLEEATKQSARWVKMFTLKHLLAGQSIDVPSVPVRPGVLVDIISKYPSHLPRHILDLYQQFFLINLSPPAGLIKLNNKVNSDIELRDSNEGQFWTSLYRQGATIPTGGIASMLSKPWRSSLVSDGIQVSHVQEIVFEQAEALLQLADEPSFNLWSNFMAPLGPPLTQYRSSEDRKAWSENGQPVVLRIVQKIEALRTPAWQRDPHRQPAVLPPTFSLRLWLLDYPQLCQSPAGACAPFVQQIVSALQEILDLGLAHRDRLDELESALSHCLPEDGRRVACALGSVVEGEEDSLDLQMKMLRVQLADSLLRRVQLPRDRDEEIVRSVGVMLMYWRRSELEDIRMRGVRLGKLWDM